MTLPAFLLAYTNSNLAWLGCKRRALPAVSSRWSLARFLAAVAIKTALAALLGCLISLLIAGQPMGWLMWLLGVFAACQSIVTSGLTALCWNRRAARLRENPNLPLGLRPLRFRLGRWSLGLIYFAVLALITPAAMLVTVENVCGQLAWKRERARLVALGERLTFREILGPEIPAAENAGAATVFAPLFDYPPGGFTRGPGDDVGDVSGLRGESSNAVVRIKDRLNLPYNYLPEKPKDAPITPKRPENVAEWSAAYRKLVTAPAKSDPSWAAELKLPAPGDPARDVLAGLAVSDAVMSEICAAAALPRAQFAVHWDEGFGVALLHLPVLKSAQINLRLRCAAHLAVGETDAAFADATNALNVAELLREEPLLISQLVRMAQGAIATSTLWQGLAEHRWTDAQLAVFQERLGHMDYLTGLIRGLEGERVWGIVGMDALIASPPTSGQTPAILRPAAVIFVPFGMLRENQVALVRGHTAMLANLRGHVAQAPQGGFATFVRERAENERIKNRKEPYSPFTALAKMMIPALAHAETKAARAQTMVNLAITACAFERHRLAHGSYPETLDALVPAFMPKPLLDPMNAQPFHYRRTDDGWFLLYSVGEDGQDDGGVFRAKPKEKIKDWPWPVPTRAEVGSLF